MVTRWVDQEIENLKETEGKATEKLSTWKLETVGNLKREKA